MSLTKQQWTYATCFSYSFSTKQYYVSEVYMDAKGIPGTSQPNIIIWRTEQITVAMYEGWRLLWQLSIQTII